MHFPLLQDIVILLGFSVAIVFALQRIKIPSIIGFLLTGVVIGPYGLSLVKAVEEVEIISEIGVILLLFVIGMELSIKQLASIRKTVFISGSLQVGLTIAVAGTASYLLGYSLGEAVFVGFLFSLSSTAIVLKIFQDRNEITTPHARNALAILIFQDIVVVPMMLLTPIIAGESTNISMSIFSLLIKSVVVIAITIVSARYLVPKLMHAIARTNNKELFLLTTMALCFAVAFLTSEAGLSLALGAFLAGLIISESEYSHQATGIILPFRELFTSFFFISVGMLLDLGFFFSHLGMIALIVLAVFILKAFIASIAVAILKYPPRTVFLTGLSLFQVGEFAFILSNVGLQYNLLDAATNQYFLAVSIVSMMLTPFVIIFSENLVEHFLGVTKKVLPSARLSTSDSGERLDPSALENHLVIIGYGVNGSNLARAAQLSGIPFAAIELNPETVRAEKQKGVPIIFGDAAQEHLLETVHLHAAKAVVVAISDPKGTKTIVSRIRNISQSVYLIVRTRYVKEIEELIALGADEVIPEEFETSVEIFSRVLHNFLVPEDDIEHLVQTIRSDNYHALLSRQKRSSSSSRLRRPDFNITCVRINKDSGKLIGKPLRDIRLRTDYGVNILAIARKDAYIDHVESDEMLHQGDLVYLHGNPEAVELFYRMMN